jgi:hypothetical protein
MRTPALAIGSAVCLIALSGCIPPETAPMMDQAAASCFVDGETAVLMLPVQVGRDVGLGQLELLDADGLELEAYTAVRSEAEPFATDRPPSSDDLAAMQASGPAEPPIAVASGTRHWLVAVVSTDGGGSSGGFRLTWDDDDRQDARLAIEVGSTCSM